jgi:hypothetical protein
MDDEAKHIIAEIFDGAGGLDAAIKWAKNNRSTFYTTMFTKLLPLTLNAKVNVNVSGEEARRKLQSAFLALEAAADAAEGTIDDVSYSHAAADVEMQPAPARSTPQLAYEQPHSNERAAPAPPRAADRPTPPPSNPVQPATEPNSTTLYYEWMNGAGSRPYFGPIGSGGGPP